MELRTKKVIINSQAVILYSLDGSAWSSNPSDVKAFDKRTRQIINTGKRAYLKLHLGPSGEESDWKKRRQKYLRWRERRRKKAVCGAQGQRCKRWPQKPFLAL